MGHVEKCTCTMSMSDLYTRTCTCARYGTFLAPRNLESTVIVIGTGMEYGQDMTCMSHGWRESSNCAAVRCDI